MNNRYLYRAKRTDNGEWIEGYYAYAYGKHYIMTVGATCALPPYHWYFENHEVDPSTICQCTGLKDKNGKLIWENDVVNCFEAEIEEYRALGTPEECRAAVEKQNGKRPVRNDKCTCPSCGTYNEVIKKRRNTIIGSDTVYCWHCGQALKIFRSDEE